MKGGEGEPAELSTTGRGTNPLSLTGEGIVHSQKYHLYISPMREKSSMDSHIYPQNEDKVKPK